MSDERREKKVQNPVKYEISCPIDKSLHLISDVNSVSDINFFFFFTLLHILLQYSTVQSFGHCLCLCI